LTGEEEFASALAEALGPLYRISLIDPKGKVRARFGDIPDGRALRADIPIPRSPLSLILELDLSSLDAATRTLQTIGVRPEGSVGVPAGAFTHIDRALSELIAMAEAQIGRPIPEMSRAEKQQLVRILDERGAFALRKSVETVADALGVSRFTVYNYLDSSRQV
jgi:hypothetical protein